MLGANRPEDVLHAHECFLIAVDALLGDGGCAWLSALVHRPERRILLSYEHLERFALGFKMISQLASARKCLQLRQACA